MSLTSQFGVNTDKEVEGVWVEYSPNKDGSIPAFKVARMSKRNKRYTKKLNRATRPHKRAIELETMKEEVADAIMLEVFVDSVLLDWNNIPLSDVTGDVEDSGVSAPFNKDNAVSLFTRLPELYEDLQAKANKASLFRDEEMEDDAKD